MKSQALDKFAMSLSAVCLLHCLLAPTALTLLPILGASALFDEVFFHQVLIWFIIPSSTVALFIGCKNHRHFQIVAVGALGMMILLLAAIDGHNLFGVIGEKWVTAGGGLILAYAHYLNYRTCRSITCDEVSNAHECATEHHH